MRDMFLLSEDQIARISPFFPFSHGRLQVDDQRDHLRDPQRISLVQYVINALTIKDNL
ncbi:MAG: hypothetical protein Q4G26_11815 [Paracoccus sp. (in: a-proteobacteria)]|nr:hypothetical protein [Paracoccus sp. (in: a-proteobacteria)]